MDAFLHTSLRALDLWLPQEPAESGPQIEWNCGLWIVIVVVAIVNLIELN